MLAHFALSGGSRAHARGESAVSKAVQLLRTRATYLVALGLRVEQVAYALVVDLQVAHLRERSSRNNGLGREQVPRSGPGRNGRAKGQCNAGSRAMALSSVGHGSSGGRTSTL